MFALQEKLGAARVGLGAGTLVQPEISPEDKKVLQLINSIHQHQYFLREHGQTIVNLVTADIISKAEARQFLDIDGYIKAYLSALDLAEKAEVPKEN